MEHAIPSSITAGFDLFAAALPPMSVRQRQLLQDAYFTGAAVVYDLVTRSPELAEADDAPGMAMLERLSAELNQYAALLSTRATRRGHDS